MTGDQSRAYAMDFAVYSSARAFDASIADLYFDLTTQAHLPMTPDAMRIVGRGGGSGARRGNEWQH
ncbi:hypothetical protein AYO41_00605 [Verrucomicrobia bacterium SCGC AG-212-E04]|nr:hypothetical protein AYO41_00605 [Verrucomicrobia bacterium SCGC AG-212-E04]